MNEKKLMDVNENNENEKTEKPKKKLSRGRIIALGIAGFLLAALIVFAVVFVVPNWGNLKAAFIWLTTSQEDIEKNIYNAKSKQAEVLKEYGFAEASPELFDAFSRGEITEQQFNDILLGKLTLEDAVKSKSPVTEQTTPQYTPSNLEAIQAYQDGEITADQLLDITENKKTLEQVREENNLREENENGIVDSDEKNDSELSEPDTAPNESQTQTPNNSSASFSQDTLDAYKNGEISDSQLSEIGKNNMTLDQAKQENAVQTPSPDTGNTPTQTPPATQTGDMTVDEQIASLVTKMYVLKAEYEGAVAGIVEQMKADYSKLPPEQRTTSAKSSIASGYMSTINAMEAQCDAQVNTIVTDLRKILTDNGRDTTLADTILSTYATEKENTKAYYLSTYGD